ncbi:MAG: hypothetical protein ACREAY_03305 [Nitrososphaera sp.]|uniref:hypothetical protein n=1 Tax=Nitrososphaera sp. TaxID=1971748 RepID=UPI003D6FB166
MAGKTFYLMLAAGAAFIVIGVASSVYSGVVVDVPLDNTVRPGLTDELSPDMEVGNTASLAVSGSTFDIEITDPEGEVLGNQTGISSFSYELTAQKAGEYRFVIENTGDEDLQITGRAQTKGNPLGVLAPLLLAVTGIIVVGLSLRFRNR